MKDVKGLFLIAGHGAGDPGACGNGYTEAERVRALCRRIKQLGGDKVMLGNPNRNWYADNGIMSLQLPDGWQILEAHMDSAGYLARGGHVITYGCFEPDEYDLALVEMLKDKLPGRADMIVGRYDLQNPRSAATMGYGYRLVEFGFISNAEDVKIFNNEMDEIAIGTLASFGISVGDVIPDADPTPAPSTGDSRKPLGKVDAYYRAYTDHWWPEVKNTEDWAGAGDNIPIKAFMVRVPEGCGYVEYEAHSIEHGWLGRVRGYDENDYNNGFAGDYTDIDAIIVYFYTPDGYEYQRAVYRASDITSNDYYAAQYDNETGDGQDGYAGVFGNAIDKIQIWIE